MEISNFFYLHDTHQRIYWLYLLSALFLALFIAKKESIKVLDATVFWHPSAKLDYIYFLVMLFIKSFVLIPLLLGANEVALSTLRVIRYFFDYHEKVMINHEVLLLLYTFTLFIVSDFTRFLLHYLMHKNRFLWRFHAVHHSAEVLTPITYYRVHPVENLLFGFRYALSAGVVTGVFIYLFSTSIGLVDILGVNAFIFIYNFLGANLRHSHIPLRFGFLEHLFISPAMHQIHHTKDGLHSNFGGVLSIWDALFKTKKRDKKNSFDFGLKKVPHTTSLKGLLLEPFYKKI